MSIVLGLNKLKPSFVSMLTVSIEKYVTIVILYNLQTDYLFILTPGTTSQEHVYQRGIGTLLLVPNWCFNLFIFPKNKKTYKKTLDMFYECFLVIAFIFYIVYFLAFLNFFS